MEHMQPLEPRQARRRRAVPAVGQLLADFGRWIGWTAPRALGGAARAVWGGMGVLVAVAAGIAGTWFTWTLVRAARGMGPRDVLQDPTFLGSPRWVGDVIQVGMAMFAGAVAAGAAAAWSERLFPQTRTPAGGEAR